MSQGTGIETLVQSVFSQISHDMPTDSAVGLRAWYDNFRASFVRGTPLETLVYGAIREKLMESCRVFQIPRLLKGFHAQHHHTASGSSSNSSTSSISSPSSASSNGKEPVVSFAHKLREFHDLLEEYCQVLADCVAHFPADASVPDAPDVVSARPVLVAGGVMRLPFTLSWSFMESVKARLLIEGGEIIREQLRLQVHENFSAFRKQMQQSSDIERRYQDQFEEDSQEEEIEAEEEEEENDEPNDTVNDGGTEGGGSDSCEDGRVPAYVHAPQEDVSMLDTRVFVGLVTDLGLLQLCIEQVRFVLREAVHRLVFTFCKDDIGVAYEQTLLNWTDRIAFPFVRLFDPSFNSSALLAMVYEELCICRISNIFEIVVDFPDSEPAVTDLFHCLTYTHMYREFSDALLASISSRLLQPGAKTIDVVNTYVAAVRIVTFLDSSRSILKGLSERVGAYLKQRPDAIRSIVLGMVEEDGDLHADLVRFPQQQQLQYVQRSSSSGGDEDPDDIQWEPVPVMAGSHVLGAFPDVPLSNRIQSATVSPSDTPIDVISLLVTLLGNREVVLVEYRSVLAQRLLAKNSFNADAEVRIHELLKLRFGEKSLHACDVILKDVTDSKRLNTQLQIPLFDQQKTESAVPVGCFHTLITSACFWPSLIIQQESDFVPHPFFKDRMTAFNTRYAALKAPRHLEWKPFLGTVDLDLELDSGEVVVLNALNPIAGSVLMHVVDHQLTHGSRHLSLTRVSQLVHLSPDIVVKRISQLLLQHILLLDADSQNLSVASALPTASGGLPLSNFESSDAEDAARRQSDAEMAIFESYIMAMLENLGSMSGDKIHNMLKMYCLDPPYDKTLEQLQAFLNKLVANEQLDRDSGQFKLRK
eukprot:ANDGO_06009.mRNA.1 Anaphase-promoting complex subunit 2